MSDRSTSLDLPFIQPTQAQKHVTHNEAIELLDLIVQLSVEEIGAETPPVAPIEGQTWALGAAPTDAWSGADGQLASYRGGGWLFVNPNEGWRAWDKSSDTLYAFINGSWISSGSELDNVDFLGINASSDLVNRLSVASEAVLFSHDGAGHQVKVNKANGTETASLMFQSNWSGRAEMGVIGEDDFSIKVSADGTNWFTGVNVKGADGSVGIESLLNLKPGTAPVAPLTGDIYFDDATAKLRCFDGTVWQDLF